MEKENEHPFMEITEGKHFNVSMDGVDYVRFGPGSWCMWYSNTLEVEYSDEQELESMFQKTLAQKKE